MIENTKERTMYYLEIKYIHIMTDTHTHTASNMLTSIHNPFLCPPYNLIVAIKCKYRFFQLQIMQFESPFVRHNTRSTTIDMRYGNRIDLIVYYIMMFIMNLQ